MKYKNGFCIQKMAVTLTYQFNSLYSQYWNNTCRAGSGDDHSNLYLIALLALHLVEGYSCCRFGSTLKCDKFSRFFLILPQYVLLRF